MKKRIPTMRTMITGGAVVLTGALGTAGVASAASTHAANTSSLTLNTVSVSHDRMGDPANRPPRAEGTPLTGATLASVTVTASAAVPNATVVRADAEANATYRVLMKKTDGTYVAVVENSSFVVTSVRQGVGARHRGGAWDPAQMTHGPGETLLTGSALTSAVTSADAAVPDTTVIRAETDAQGATYEVHLKKADGTDVTVKENTSFVVTSTESGFAAPPVGTPNQGFEGSFN